MFKSINKKVIAICVLFVTPVAFGGFSGITIINDIHQVQGAYYDTNKIFHEYNIVDTVPQIQGGGTYVNSKIDWTSVCASAYGDTESNLGASAHYHFEFEPLVKDLRIQLDGYLAFSVPWTEVEFKIQDPSAQTVFEYRYDGYIAVNQSSDGRWYYNVDKVITGLDIGGHYSLDMYAIAGTGDGGTALMNLNCSDATVVPLPSSLLLTGLGTLLVRRFKKH